MFSGGRRFISRFRGYEFALLCFWPSLQSLSCSQEGIYARTIFGIGLVLVHPRKVAQLRGLAKLDEHFQNYKLRYKDEETESFTDRDGA